MKLFTERITASDAQPERVALVLHGVFGSGANWRMFMRALVKERPDWAFVLCDLRGHARSLGGMPPHNLEAMADDLAELSETLEEPVRAVIGHSLGGKVALTYATHGARDLEQVWVLDSQPGARPFRGMTVDVLELLERLPRTFAQRSEFVNAVIEAGQPKAIAAWLAMNVRREGERLIVQLDLPALRAVLEDFYETDAWSALETGLETHVVVATASSIWVDGDHARLAKLAAEVDSVRVHALEGAGHFVNVDAPDALRAILAEHL